MSDNYRGKTALITGASSGIGKEYAYQLAAAGANVALVARSEDVLHDIAGDIYDQYQVDVHVIAVDLSTEAGVQNVIAAAEALDLKVDLLINNAGFGTHGHFHELDAQHEHEQVQLNVTALTDLCRAFLPSMVERKNGAILNVASIAAFQAMPYMSVYAATKAYVLSLSEGLAAEYKPHGIKVMALCPGPVATGFFEATNSKQLSKLEKHISAMSASEVAEQSLAALKAGKTSFIPGLQNKLSALSTRFASRKQASSIVAKVLKPR